MRRNLTGSKYPMSSTFVFLRQFVNKDGHHDLWFNETFYCAFLCILNYSDLVEIYTIFLADGNRYVYQKIMNFNENLTDSAAIFFFLFRARTCQNGDNDGPWTERTFTKIKRYFAETKRGFPIRGNYDCSFNTEWMYIQWNVQTDRISSV